MKDFTIQVGDKTYIRKFWPTKNSTYQLVNTCNRCAFRHNCMDPVMTNDGVRASTLCDNKTIKGVEQYGYFEEMSITKENQKTESKSSKEKRKFDPKKCQKQVKEQFSIGDVTFTLTSHHAFEWSIAKTENGKITISVYQNRNAAKKEFERKKRLKRKL